jgi:hypothetical protein
LARLRLMNDEAASDRRCARIGGEQPPQIAVVGFRRVEDRAPAFFVIVAERLPELAERIDLFPMVSSGRLPAISPISSSTYSSFFSAGQPA